jgi:hypothetical protein
VQIIYVLVPIAIALFGVGCGKISRRLGRIQVIILTRVSIGSPLPERRRKEEEEEKKKK